ncbi:MAG: hypothetical protein R3A46_09895 [Thermomicrobiales bacterium]
MPRKNWLEWSVFSISTVLLIVILGYLGYDAFTSEGDPAEIEVQLGTPEPHEGYYAVPVRFSNSGGQSVEDVEVDITLMQDGQEIETASVTAPVLPRQSSRKGWVVFSSNPDDADTIETQIVSYVVP